jgi:hypothetical protein
MDDYGNNARWGAFRDACLNRSILPGVWFTDGWNIGATPIDAKFAIVEIESENDRQGLINHLGRLPNCPVSIVTNFTPFTDSQGVPLPEKAAPLIEAGITTWITEAYLGDNQNYTPERLDFTAKKLGAKRTQPLFGIHNKPLSEYSQWFGWPGWSIYLAEYAYV